MSERTPAKAERNAAIVERRLAGVSVKRLAREFAICPQRVKQLTAGIGVPPRMAGRPVMVGGVIFDTVTAAARAAGISQGEGSKRAARGRKGWRFLGPITMALALAACCGGAEAHDWYSALRSPDTGVSCCGGQDCHPTEYCTLPNGKQGLVSHIWGCEPIQWGKVLGIASPDGLPHICEPAAAAPSTTPVVYCYILGGSV